MQRRSVTRIFLTVFLAFLASFAPLPAQTPLAEAGTSPAADSAAQPKIEFSDLEHDFGQAVSGEDLKTTFAFKNVGDAVLIIEKVKGG
jgi:hypothetical protein